MPPELFPPDEAGRAAALGQLRILDTPPEERFDRIVRLAASLFEVPIAYLSLLDKDRQWVKSAVGLGGAQFETPRDVSFCGHAILQDGALVVPDALEDPRFANNPMVTGEPFVRFYAGYPVRSVGAKVGSLCVVDRNPRHFGKREIRLLAQLGELIEHEFALVGEIALREEMLRTREAFQKDLSKLYRELAREKRKSDQLLQNILPAKIAEELRRYGRVDAQHHQEVCVMFTDFTEFTNVSELFTPAELVSELNACFSEFDAITGRHGVEKLKTVGDGYLCVSGLLERRETSARDLAFAALEIRDFIAERRKRFLDRGRPYWDVRIGIHNGPLVAGIVGARNYAFDVWGDTVNVASRLESVSEPGRINISRAFFERVSEYVECECRGSVFTKSKGGMEMFFMERRR